MNDAKIVAIADYLKNRFPQFNLEEQWQEPETRDQCFRLGKGKEILLIKITNPALDLGVEQIEGLLSRWDERRQSGVLLRKDGMEPFNPDNH